MLVTVTERTREIGIRKAIGAEHKSIIAQFLIEAAVICGIGGVIGIILGYLGTLIAGKLLLQMILMPNTTITIGAFVFSVVLGIIFGLYPAVKASVSSRWKPCARNKHPREEKSNHEKMDRKPACGGHASVPDAGRLRGDPRPFRTFLTPPPNRRSTSFV